MELENKDPTTEPVSLPLGFLRFITDDFCHERELGKGASGVVYKGILPCGSVIAIKKFDERIIMGDDQSFKDEASFLMDIEHQNVVQLLGYCAESSGVLMKPPNRKGIVLEQLTRLCFEYMCNGCLDEHLSDESSGLEWNTRYKIIKGICSGLEYLHERNIIHRDLKPQNILMDIIMVPKIADFGLSRLLDEKKLYAVTSNLAGTLGYMAPEYINKGEISKEADIFSLGVIIIQILTGCKNGYPDYLRDTKTDFQCFTEKVLSNWRNRFETPSKYTSPELQTQLVKQCIDIALECVHPDKEKRPNVSNIIEILNAAEKSCYHQNGEGLPVDRQMGAQEGLPTSGVLREDGLVALNKIALKDHVQAWMKKGMMKSVVAPLQPQHEPVLESVDGSLATLCYQGARNASFWVAHKALASLEDNVLKDWAATINLGPSLQALERELKSVMVILELALGKVIHNLALEGMLTELRELVYEAEDMLDEMEYFRIQGDVLDASQHVEGCAHDNLDHNVLPSVHDEPPKLRFDMDNASRRIEHIVEQMQLMQQKVSSAIKLLGSDWSTAPNIAQSRPITISESIEPKLYGRELLMKSIIDDITKGKHSHDVLTVIPIVGPGGIGKTTLAQHIYHTREVQEHFNVKVWTCVSLNFNVNKLIKEIKGYISKVDRGSRNGTDSELIGQILENKRFLLVLDDIWDCSDEDEWKRLLVPFRKSQVQGNIIIVTTRFPAQAQIMARKRDHSIYLQGLESKEFDELFLEIIFGGDDQCRKDHSFLHETGFRIAGRLKGSPLAAKTVGRLLKSKLDLVHWTRILESKEWEHSDGKNDIMHTLKLSFDYLPSQLQQCFSYCALFPQDYKFKRQELINFWIGQEILHSSHGENKRVEDIGLNHFTELVNYGFLEKQEKDGMTWYTIHDLLHELARKVSSLEFLSIDSSQSQVSSLKVLPSVRHLSINIGDTHANDRLTLKNCVEDFNTLDKRLNIEKLRTLMIFGKPHGYVVKVFRKAKALRLVFLTGAFYDVKDLLHNFDYLIHLRYLRIGWSYKVRLPNIISRFYHMKVIDAKHCNIDRLPTDISNLVNLRHLLVEDDTIHSSITKVGKLKSLQGLRRFLVKQDDQGFKLRQIGHLEELRGSLCIDGLENVQLPEEADEAKLMLKSHLHELILRWNNNYWLTNDSALEKHVLERLKPSCNLQKLSIIGHRGGTCPSWLGLNLSLSSLESLCLDDVNWKTFPPIGDLWLVNLPREEISNNIPEKRFGNLRRLELVKLSGLKTWVVHSPRQLFPYLEVLIIRDCSRLVELSFSHSVGCCQQGKDANDKLFSKLSKLEIESCPQLSSFPPVPWTEALSYIKIQGTSSLDYLLYRKDDELAIWGNKDTYDRKFWNVLPFHNLTGLKHLEMSRCRFPPLRYLQMLSSLRTIDMSSPSNVFSFVEADCHVKYQFPIESLIIDEWSASGKELTQLLTYFPKLSNLELKNCHKVTGLGVNSLSCIKDILTIEGNKDTDDSFVEADCHVKYQFPVESLIIHEWIASGKELTQLLTYFPKLSNLELKNCQEHDDSNEEDGRTGGGGGLSLRRLKIMNCPEFMSSSYSSSSLSSSFPFPNSLEHLDIYGAVGMDTLVHLSNLTCLKSLSLSHSRGEGLSTLLIQGHPTKLSVDSEHSQVREQEIPSCSFKLQEPRWVHLSNLTSLTSLSMTFCDLRCEGLLSLLTQGQLTKLSVIKTPNFFVDSEPPWMHEQELPSHSSKLQEVKIGDVSGFTAAPIRHNLIFSTLTKLEIYGDDKVERFTEEQEALLFVNSLEMIKFESFLSLQFLPERLHELPNLKMLRIYHCHAIQMLPKDGLSSSLQELKIGDCPKIRLLPKHCLPDSLLKLEIMDCPAIQSLPEVDDLPSSLRVLNVEYSGSEKLRSQCRKWINIIPIVKA